MPNQYEDQIAQEKGAYEPQRQHTWVIRVAGFEGFKTLELALRTGFLPSISNEEIEIPYMNSRVYVAGKHMVEAGTIAFNDYVDKNTAGILAEWRKLVYDEETGAIGLAANYKKEGIITLYGPNFETKREWKIRGMWPQNIVYGTLDYGASDVVQIETTFRYDDAIPTFIASSGGLAGVTGGGG